MAKDLDTKKQPFLKNSGRWTIGLAMTAALATGIATVYTITNIKNPRVESTPPPNNAPVMDGVSALGRLEPEGEVIKLSAAGTLEGVRILSLKVKEGDKVKSGDTIAILDNLNQKQAALQQAKQQVNVSRSRLAQVKAGAKEGEINAQQATITRIQAQLQGDIKAQEAIIARLEAQLAGEIGGQQATIGRLEAEVKNASAEYERYRKLSEDGATSDSVRDAKRLSLETSRKQLIEAQANLNKTQATLQEQINEAKTNLNKIISTGRQQIDEAKSNLNRIAEVRPVDIQAAQAEVDSAIATVDKAQADLDLSYVKSPITGQILKIHTRPGEKISDKGIAEIGQTQQMYVVAEVYESDIDKVRLNQRAKITGDSISGELQGTVAQIGLKIGKKDVLDTDPAADVDARVVEVKIRLEPEDSKRVSGLTNLKVDVKIYL